MEGQRRPAKVNGRRSPRRPSWDGSVLQAADVRLHTPSNHTGFEHKRGVVTPENLRMEDSQQHNTVSSPLRAEQPVAGYSTAQGQEYTETKQIEPPRTPARQQVLSSEDTRQSITNIIVSKSQESQSVTHISELERSKRLYESLLLEAVRAAPTLSRDQFLQVLESHGLQADDQRLAQIIKYIKSSKRPLNEEDIQFIRLKSDLVERALTGRLIIPDFVAFTDVIKQIYDKVLPDTSGHVATYIPQLARVDPDQFGVAVCTIDGQRFAHGDHNTRFCIQSCSKVITYAIAQTLHGVEKVHRHVGTEPSGRSFNQMCLDERNRDADIAARRKLRQEGKSEEADAMKIRPAIPHNPCVNAGAIMCTSLTWADLGEDERFDKVMSIWKAACGYHKDSPRLRAPTFANATYLSERASGDRNYGLAYMMKDAGAFPEGTDLVKTLESYFMFCSIETTTEMLAVVAGTLANNGTCPATGEKVFPPDVVRNCLSIMFSCGMYDDSGQFAYHMGFPCKSGVGGSIIVVIPGVCGFCVWSPRLDEIGNSARGVKFCHELSTHFRFHMFYAGSEDTERVDPTRDVTATSYNEDLFGLLYAAADGEIQRCRELLSRGISVNATDYDGRTALHLATCNNHLDCVNYLLQVGANPDLKDRFGGTARTEAQSLGHREIVEVIKLLGAEPLPAADPADPSDVLIKALDPAFDGVRNGLTQEDIIQVFLQNGIAQTDSRVQQLRGQLSNSSSLGANDMATIASNEMALRALQGRLVIPDWSSFCDTIASIYAEVEPDNQGQTAQYIPVLARADPDKFGVAACSIDGQRFSIGDTKEHFGVQSCMKPINYAMALEEHGFSKVDEHVGCEPSGLAFNEMALDDRHVKDGKPKIPHNPLINAGAVMISSLVQKGKPISERLDYIRSIWSRMAGGADVSISTEMADSEAEEADRNWCLAYMMNESKAFPEGTSLAETLHFYFNCCSIMMDAEGMSLVAATLANGGVCPITNDTIFSPATVRSVLSVMFTCGMYDFSGQWCYSMGFPAKSGVGGGILVVIPNVCGYCTWSPRLDMNGNSYRGIAFSARLANKYTIHCFETGEHLSDKEDLRFRPGSRARQIAYSLNQAASVGDIPSCAKILAAHGVELVNSTDYDDRTPLHLAAVTCAPAFGPPNTTSVHVLATADAGLFNTPRDLQFHPSNPNELWVANSGTADMSVLTFWSEPSARATRASFHAVRVSDRAKYHYMASVSSLAFGAGGRFATCQESMNDYDGLTARGFPEGMGGNRFMGPSLFESDPHRRVNSMGELCSSAELHDATQLGPPNSKSECFLRHIDMLHESPLCMGIAHDPEQFSSCQGGSATVQRNVFWSFDGYGRLDQTPTSGAPRRGMLMRYDFERDHGGCNGYLCADHGEAEVRRYEDVVLTRAPGVASHIVLGGGGHRDLWVADSGAGRLLRVDPDSGRAARTAIYEWTIYSSSHLHFNYKVWSCTTYEVFADASTPGLLPDDAAEFVPSGIALGGDVVYVSNHATGNVIAFDVYTGEVVSTVQTGRPRALAGLEVRTGVGQVQQLFVLDQVQGDLLLVMAATAGCSSSGSTPTQRPRRPYPANATSCDPNAAAFDEPTVGAAIEHDPGYMNIAIPYTYGGNVSVPCHDPTTGQSNFNLDALLMAGHTCHRCLPEPCRNGGLCTGVQEHGFSCACPAGYDGDLCQRRVPGADGENEGEIDDAYEEAVDQQEEDEASAEPVSALDSSGHLLGPGGQGGGSGATGLWLGAGAAVLALLAPS